MRLHPECGRYALLGVHLVKKLQAQERSSLEIPLAFKELQVFDLCLNSLHARNNPKLFLQTKKQLVGLAYIPYQKCK